MWLREMRRTKINKKWSQNHMVQPGGSQVGGGGEERKKERLLFIYFKMNRIVMNVTTKERKTKQ